ncbi:hypothetical protein MKW98_031558, partial [Papaver atlanticum]
SWSGIIGFLVEEHDINAANELIRRIISGENWTGLFAGRNKQGQLLQIFATTSPFYDDNGALVGVICLTSDSEFFRENITPVSCSTNPLKDDFSSSSSCSPESGLTVTNPSFDSQHKCLEVIVPSIMSKL